MNTIFTAFSDGASRVRRAPAIQFGMYLLLLLMTALPGLAVRQDIEASLGSSGDAKAMAEGVSLEWWNRFDETSSGLSESFSPTIIGFGAVLDNVSRIADHGTLPVAVAALVGANILAWLFLAGGILDRFARNRATRGRAFFGSCGIFFPRFLRLGVIGLAGYALLFGYVHGWLFDRLWNWIIHDLTVERTAFFVRIALYAFFGALVVFWNVVLDYAKIRAVVEDRYSMLGALVAAWRFVFSHPGIVAGLYFVNGLCFVAILALYALVAPGVGGPSIGMWMAFLIGQIYIVARLFVKLTFWASQTALFQQSLAHAAYTAPPVPMWPESPAAEGITNAAVKL